MWIKSETFNEQQPDRLDTTSSKNTIYERRNFTKITKKNIDGTILTGWEYEERQYTPNEYIQLISEKNAQLETDQLALSDAVADIIMGGM